MTPSNMMQPRSVYWLPALALLAVPAAAQASDSNAVVIDFDQGRLLLGWIGLWLVALLTFGLCADKRTQPMARLARLLERRAQRRASRSADDAIRELARDDPRILADLIAATDRASADEIRDGALQRPSGSAPVATAPRRNMPARGFRTAPLPGLPQHMQYLPS